MPLFMYNIKKMRGSVVGVKGRRREERFLPTLKVESRGSFFNFKKNFDRIILTREIK